jgi:prevent-host-death family protein
VSAGEKRCAKCRETKPSSAFSTDRGQPDGLYAWCKPCAAANLREYRAAHPEYVQRDRERIEAAGWLGREAREGVTRMGGETRTIDATTFQRNIGTTFDEVKAGGTAIITHHGRPAVAIIPAQRYEALLAAEAKAREETAARGMGIR